MEKLAEAISYYYQQRKGKPYNGYAVRGRLFKKFPPDITEEIMVSILKYKPDNPFSYGEKVGKNVTTIKEVNVIIAKHEQDKKDEATDVRGMFNRMEMFFNQNA